VTQGARLCFAWDSGDTIRNSLTCLVSALYTTADLDQRSASVGSWPNPDACGGGRQYLSLAVTTVTRTAYGKQDSGTFP